MPPEVSPWVLTGDTTSTGVSQMLMAAQMTLYLDASSWNRTLMGTSGKSLILECV